MIPRFALVIMLASAIVARDAIPAVSTIGSTALQQAVDRYGRLPLAFERVADKATRSVRFVARCANYAVAVSAQGMVFAPRTASAAAASGTVSPFGIRFVDADPRAAIEGVDPLATRIHHLRGGGSDVDVSTYERVIVTEPYPGVDLAFHGRGNRLEYDIVVAPGAGDPSRVAFRVDEDVDLSLNDSGDLVLAAPAGSVTLQRPAAYQDIGGERRAVASAFALDSRRDFHIVVGSYDRARALVIDPVVSYATYLGGSAFDQGVAIAVDSSGNAYIAGSTASPDFPAAGAYDRSLGRKGDVDAFVSKLNATGTGLVWSTYLGGSTGVDRAVGIAVDATGNAYVTGTTSGSDFPTTVSAWQKPLAAGGAFVAKLAAAGNALVYSTYVAGANPSGIAIDASGSAYVSGSATPAFVTTPGAFQPTPRNVTATGFLLALDASGSAPRFATFVGGSASDDATSIAVDSRGSIYVGGWTTSRDFPIVNALQSPPGAGKDAFVAKFDASGSRLSYSTILGGALDDSVNAIAVDSAGFSYVAGETYSPDFPIKGGFQQRKAGSNLINSSVGNAFVAKLSPTGDALVYSSFLGGEVCLTLCQLTFGPLPQYRADAAYGIAVDAAGHAYVSGIARSYTFPLVDSTARRKQEDNEDSAFIAKVAISGGTLLWSTFLRTGYGESDNKWTRFPPGAATGVAIDKAGAVFVTGDADSSSNFQPTTGAFQTSSSGTFAPDAVVVKFPPSPTMSLTTSNASVDTQTAITLAATLGGATASGSVTFVDGASSIGSASLVGNTATLATTLPAGIHPLSAILHLQDSTVDTPVVLQVVDVPFGCAAP